MALQSVTTETQFQRRSDNGTREYTLLFGDAAIGIAFSKTESDLDLKGYGEIIYKASAAASRGARLIAAKDDDSGDSFSASDGAELLGSLAAAMFSEARAIEAEQDGTA